MTIPTINFPPMASYQLDAIFCPDKSAIIEATTKAGKTVGCIFWLLGEALSGKFGHEFWWVAPIYEQTKIAYRRYKNTLLLTDPAGRLWKHNDTDPSITLNNGAVIRFKSADKPDHLYGEDVYAAVFDEASRAKEDAWHALQSTLTATDGRVRVIGNVRGRKNWAFRLARKVQAGSLPGWKYSSITAADAVKAKIIKASVLEERKAVLPHHVFRELYYNEPSEDGGNPFGLQHIAACCGEMSDEEPEAFGIDLAKSVDWTEAVGLDKNRAICSYHRWQHEPWDRTSERILEIIKGVPALIDSTGVGDPVVEGMQRKAPAIQGFKFTAQSKQQIMEGLAVAIQSHSISGIPDGLRQQLENFEYNTERAQIRYSAPDGFHDDGVCALALAVEMARQRIPVTVGFVVHGPQPLPQLIGPEPELRNIFDEKRKDPNWGFEGVKERYR